MKFRFALIFILATSLQAFSQSMSFGHNLAVTTDTLPKGEMTFGNYAVGAGLTDDFSILTSPWMQFSYNADNIGARWKKTLSQDWVLGQQAAYMNTDPAFGTNYDMTAMLYWATLAHAVSPNYKINVTLNYMYFWKEGQPFSLRREPYNDEPFQFSLSTLHQLYFSDKILTQFEVGVLGMNYAYPFLQLGSSFVYLEKRYSIQLGASVSVMPPWNYNSQAGALASRTILTGENSQDTSIHPEVQVQYWF